MSVKHYWRLMWCGGIGMLLLATAGCATATSRTFVASEEQFAPEGYRAVANAEAVNYGYFLFNFIPIVSGNDGRPNTNDYRFFANRVRPSRNQRMLEKALARYDVDVVANVQHHSESYGAFSLWTLWCRRIESSAVGLRRARSAAAPEAAK